MLSEMMPSALLLALSPDTAAYMAPRMLMGMVSWKSVGSVAARRCAVVLQDGDERAHRHRDAIDIEGRRAVLDAYAADRADRLHGGRDRALPFAARDDAQRIGAAVGELLARARLAVPREAVGARGGLAGRAVDHVAARVLHQQRGLRRIAGERVDIARRSAL